MLAAVGAAGAAGGLFLILWYRTLASLPEARQPKFIHAASFKIGVPIAGLGLVVAGLLLLASVSLVAAGLALVAGGMAAWALIRFDRYTADMGRTYERYRRIRAANPDMTELEVLFHTAEARYPGWPQDRLVELVAGKDIAGLLLLMIVKDHGIHPLSDWELYRSLRARVAKVTRADGN